MQVKFWQKSDFKSLETNKEKCFDYYVVRIE